MTDATQTLFSQTLSDGGATKQEDVLLRAWPNPTYKPDAFKDTPPVSTPWITEVTYAHSSPREWEDRITNKTVVHTGGGTDTAAITHHTVMRPKMPPGSISTATFNLSQYLPKEDVAVQELHNVTDQLAPHLSTLQEALRGYGLHCPEDAWVSPTGFVSTCGKAGIKLSRADYLTLERSVPKDTMGRINYEHVFQVVEAVSQIHGTGNLAATVPECLSAPQQTTGTTRRLQTQW